MARRGFRIPMFWKFLAGSLALASLLIYGGYRVALSESKFSDRGP